MNEKHKCKTITEAQQSFSINLTKASKIKYYTLTNYQLIVIISIDSLKH